MKDLLIVTSPSSNRHIETCKEMKTAIQEYKGELKLDLETAFLLNGPTSFQIASVLYDIADRNKVPFAVFEVGSVLFSPLALTVVPTSGK
jgi:hypothetical protein